MALETFLNDVYERKCIIKNSFPDEVVLDIEKSVRQLLWKIIRKANTLRIKDILKVPESHEDFSGTFRDLFQINTLIPVGSFYEGTRVGDPFEFDFMLLIDFPDLEIVQGCGPGLVRIKRPSDTPWENFTSDEYLQVNNANCEYPSITGIFNEIIWKLTNADSSILTDDDRVVESPSGYLKCMPSGMLHLAFLWSPKDDDVNGDQIISVDTMPSIVCPLEPISNLHEKFIDLVKEHKCYIIPKQCIKADCIYCFHVTFATSENKLMRDMDCYHKRCYSILKHLVSLKSEFEDALTDVSSYKLKTCLLYHVYDSDVVCTKSDIGNCALDILQRLIECYQNMKMPKFFQRDSSLFDKAQYSCSVLDILILGDSEVGKLISQNKNEGTAVMEAANSIAWFELTRSILMIFNEYLKTVKSVSIDKYNFVNVFLPFENIALSLNQHLGTSKEMTVQRDKWTEKLNGLGNQIYSPLYSVLVGYISDHLLKQLQCKICPILPVKMIMSNELKIAKDENLLKQLKSLGNENSCTSRYFVRMSTGWFSIYDGQKIISKNYDAELLPCESIIHHLFCQEFEI